MDEAGSGSCMLSSCSFNSVETCVVLFELIIDRCTWHVLGKDSNRCPLRTR